MLRFRPVKEKKKERKKGQEWQVWSISPLALYNGPLLAIKTRDNLAGARSRNRNNPFLARERERERATVDRLNGSGRCVRPFPINLSINVARGPVSRNLPIIKYFPIRIDRQGISLRFLSSDSSTVRERNYYYQRFRVVRLIVDFEIALPLTVSLPFARHAEKCARERSSRHELLSLFFGVY